MIMSDIKRMHMAARYSDTAVHNGVVYLAGQVPTDTSQDMAGQAREVLETIDRLLNEVGSDKSRILMTQIFLPDLKDYDVMNVVWDSWVVAGHAPPRATIQAKLANPDWKIEVVVTAAVR
ncbi:MAG: RidA family protein [Moraxellaceae bacterium]|jgi:enamine deaminase RidA (YjgF/YER057c/UK114 family)|nr:RidA family protein [Moraxellaceae bacterium]